MDKREGRWVWKVYLSVFWIGGSKVIFNWLGEKIIGKNVIFVKIDWRFVEDNRWVKKIY